MSEDTKKETSLWPGLEPYSDTENDAARFFGRSVETRDLTQRIERRISTVFFAESGAGKTSLLRAGVFPALRKSGLHPVYIRFDHAETAPPLLDQVWNHLKRENLIPEGRERCNLWEWCHDTADGLLSERTSGARVVFVFDQFEEIFTIGMRHSERKSGLESLIEQIADLVEHRLPLTFQKKIDDDESFPLDRFDLEADAYRVVIALREDYLSLLDREKERMPSVMQNRMLLDRLKGRPALEVIEGPDRSILGPGMGERILRYVAGEEKKPLDDLEVEPALLSLVCRRLDLARKGKPISAGLLDVEKDQILESFYEECFDGLPRAARDFVETELVTEGGHRQSLVSFGVGEKIGVKALETLIDRRLLHTEQHGQTPKVELTHDVLVPVVLRSRAASRARAAELAAKETERLVQERLASESRKRRKLAWALAASVLITSAAVVFGLVALHFKRRAEQNEEKWRVANLELDSAKTDAEKRNEALAHRTEEVEKLNSKLEKVNEDERQARELAVASQNTTERYLKHFLDRASELVSSAGAGTSGLGPKTRIALLQKGKGMYESLGKIAGDSQPELRDQIRMRLFEIDLGLADATMHNLDHGQAFAILEKAGTSLEELPASFRASAALKLEESKGDVVWDEAGILQSKATTAKDRGEQIAESLAAESNATYKRAALFYEKALELTEDDKLSKIRVRNKLANTYRRLGDWAKAEDLLAISLAEAEALPADKEGNPKEEKMSLMADASNKLGNLYLDRVTFRGERQMRAKAEEAYRSAVKIRRDTLAINPENAMHRYELAISLANLSDVLTKQNKPEKSTLEIYRERVDIAKQLYDENPENLFFRRFYTDGLRFLAIKMDANNKPKEFLAMARQAVMADRFQSSIYLRTYSNALRENKQVEEARSVDDMIRTLDAAQLGVDGSLGE